MRPVHAIKWTLMSQAFRGAVQLLQLIILAKMLGPSQYGLIALVMAFTNFALIFSDLGLTAAYIQSRNVTSDERDVLFTCNVVLGCIIALAIIISAPFIANGFGRPSIEGLVRLSALIVIITALGQQVRASAEKVLKFRPIAIIEISGNLIGFSATIALAWNGSGAASIIWGTIAYSGVITVLPWVHFPESIKPRLVRILRIDKKHLKYGINTVANGVLANLTLNSDIFLSSRIIGESALGSYSLPRNLTLQIQALVNPPLNRVSFPILSKFQNNRSKVGDLFKAIASITTALNTPLYLILLFYAGPIINISLGAGWTSSIDLLKIFAYWGVMRTCLNPPGTLLLAINKVQSLRNWNLMVFIATCLTTLIAAPYGPKTIAQSLALVTTLQVVLIWFTLLRKNTDVGFIEYLGEILFPVIIGVVSIGGVSAINPIGVSTQSQLISQLSVSVVIYLLMAYALLRNRILVLIKPID